MSFPFPVGSAIPSTFPRNAFMQGTGTGPVTASVNTGNSLVRSGQHVFDSSIVHDGNANNDANGSVHMQMAVDCRGMDENQLCPQMITFMRRQPSRLHGGSVTVTTMREADANQFFSLGRFNWWMRQEEQMRQFGSHTTCTVLDELFQCVGPLLQNDIMPAARNPVAWFTFATFKAAEIRWQGCHLKPISGTKTLTPGSVVYWMWRRYEYVSDLDQLNNARLAPSQKSTTHKSVPLSMDQRNRSLLYQPSQTATHFWQVDLYVSPDRAPPPVELHQTSTFTGSCRPLFLALDVQELTDMTASNVKLSIESLYPSSDSDAYIKAYQKLPLITALMLVR